MGTRFVPMADVKSASLAAGSHWFEPDSMRFFRTRLPLLGKMDDGGRVWFVSSEAPRSGNRKYSVRVFIPQTGSVQTHGTFHSYASSRDAQRAVDTAIAAGIGPQSA